MKRFTSLAIRSFLLLALAALLPACSTSSGPRGSISYRKANAPANAPAPVKQAIHAGNQLAGKPYKWGGGHGSFEDSGYDCSGTVSYALGRAGLLSSPLNSQSFMNYGEKGKGKWITIYARKGHTFMVVAGMRLDTTSNRGNTGPGWRGSARSLSGFVARHPAGL
ncbi:MAG TPA: NlpC/P60 family protein [Chthoniobacterales bacterium]|jgi:hypothetical protein